MIREMQEHDLNQVLAIEEECFQHPWTKDQFLYELQGNEFAYLYVLEDDEIIKGFIDFWITFDQVQLAQIAIRKDEQGKGLSKQLIDTMLQFSLEKEAEHISLEVRPSNVSALALYKGYGFIEMNHRKGYYHDGEDAVVMVKPLGGY